ncbi:hypothetical protein R6Q59_019241 [Mikania micrantha]
MDFDIPTDLIDKARIGFREAAGLSFFDRNLPISTVEASLDPSPSYLRCNFCQGKLLRGLQSLICVYCGEYQKTKDLHLEPISFKSTHAYSWLLQSLNFNGSERIGSLAEGNGINGDKSPAEDELTLSELLDLKISLQDEPKKLENSFYIRTSDHASSLNIYTTDFDNFFTKSETAIVSDVLEEQPVVSKADQIKIIEGQESFTTDWDADFQSADTKMENEKPKSVGLSEGAEADLSSHMDVIFGQTKSFDFKQPNDESDLFQDDPFVNMSSVTFQQNERVDSADQAKDGSSGALNDFNLQNVGGEWVSDGNWQKSSVKITLNDGSVQDNLNDSSTDWFENTNWLNDSTNNIMSTVKDDNLFDIRPHANDLIQSEKSDLDNSDKHDSDITDWFQNNQWEIGGSTSTTNIVVSKDENNDLLNDGKLQDNPNISSTDWFENTNGQTDSTNRNPANIKDNLFDIKADANDFIQPEKSDFEYSDKHHPDVTDWFQNSQWASGVSNSTANVVVSKDDEVDDGFGEWNDFTSSAGNQDSVKDSWKENSNEKVDFGTSKKMLELNLFQPTVDSKEVDFGNFLQSDMFSGDKNANETRAAYDVFSEVSTAIRNTNREAGNNAEGSKNDKITPNVTTSPNDDVQLLLSQMHDLSFMLKNELSVPSKPDDSGTSHS